MNKRFYTPMLIMGLVGLSVFGVDQVRAQGGFGNYQTLVQKIAQKFNLKEADVQTVLNEVQQERQRMMEAKFEDRKKSWFRKMGRFKGQAWGER